LLGKWVFPGGKARNFCQKEVALGLFGCKTIGFYGWFTDSWCSFLVTKLTC